MNRKDIERLIEEALKARDTAYVPYSHYAVGAALLTQEGAYYRGCNIESASYGATICAERTALCKAVSEGERKFSAIAVVGGMQGKQPADYAYPCGICRQLLKEFVDRDFTVIVAKDINTYERYKFEELLPHGFGGTSIQ